MEIIFEDKDIVVAIKPPEILSQGDEKGRANAVDILKDMTGSEIFPVHRLDKGVGGVMVFAKNSKSAAELSRQVSDRTMEKTYLALLHGEITEEKGRLEDLLFFDRGKNKSFVVKRERRGVKKALLDYECIERGQGKSLVRVSLITGRTHQIRVQFSSRGYPLFGDRRYGAKDEEKNIALLSKEISFLHPKTGERMSFESQQTIKAI
ncbi:MAG: RluA family pseudouridine synthase [Clostridia bacterium]|nr:RluA family pseudouridine synthase [Clostridia bacterium]